MLRLPKCGRRRYTSSMVFISCSSDLVMGCSTQCRDARGNDASWHFFRSDNRLLVSRTSRRLSFSESVAAHWLKNRAPSSTRRLCGAILLSPGFLLTAPISHQKRPPPHFQVTAFSKRISTTALPRTSPQAPAPSAARSPLTKPPSP